VQHFRLDLIIIGFSEIVLFAQIQIANFLLDAFSIFKFCHRCATETPPTLMGKIIILIGEPFAQILLQLFY